MWKNKPIYALILVFSALLMLFTACSNQKNTAVTRAYHSINTRYNVHFNAQEAYNEALKAKSEGRKDNLSEMVYIYPVTEDENENYSSVSGTTSASTIPTSNTTSTSASSTTGQTVNNAYNNGIQSTSGSFGVTIDKTTKAIKEHSIKVKPKRDASKRGDKKYQAWIKQQEFNPFLKNTWVLLGKAELENGDYLRSAATFSYISKIYSTNPEMVAESRLWIARAYSEMGWLYEAENVLRKIDQAGGVPDKLQGLYSSVYANLYTQLGEYEKSVPHLELAIKKEKNKLQKMRMEYLLGQVYTKTGDYNKAYAAYDQIPGMSTPYEFEFNARLQQMDLPGMNENNKILNDLNKMTKRSKNKEYLDQIYYAIGKNYLQHNDTTKAIENYRTAIEKSIRNGYDKAIAQIALGDVYFDQHKFILAQPPYAEALPSINKSNERYPRLALRSSVLDELVVHVKTVHEQDSLQHLAQLPEAERLQVINTKIENLKKEEEERRKEEENEKRREERESRVSSWDDLMSESMFEDKTPTRTQFPTQSQTGSTANFYFYDSNIVAQGKIAFQKQWGNRKLEDDWRRRNKSTSSFDDGFFADTEELATDSTKTNLAETDVNRVIEDSNKQQIIDDVYSVDYYLQQLPFTVEAIKESNDLIEDALYNMGLIYKNKLENYSLAIDAFDTDIRRFPETPNLEDIYYQLFLIYMQLENKDMMAFYRNKLLSEFSSGSFALALTDPNYEWNLKNMGTMQEQLYEKTYEAYINGDIATVRKNYEEIRTKYPFADLMPKFMLLNGLSYAQTRDAENLKTSLTKLVDTYPKSDVEPLASNILKRINDGQILLSDGTPITGFDWSGAYISEEYIEGDSVKQFAVNPDNEFVLLFTFLKGSIDRNDLLFNIANYNFSNYVVQTFDLGFDNMNSYDILQVKGFKSFDEIKSYIIRGFERELFTDIDPKIVVIPVATDNYSLFLALGVKEYISFFEANYPNQLPQLIALWNNEEIPSVEDIANLITENATPQPDQEPVTNVENKITETKKPEEPVISDKKTDIGKNENLEISAEDILTEEQQHIAEKINENIAAAEEVLNNPVDGIKNILKRRRENPKLTKEEKEAEKEQKRLDKERQKELKTIEKLRTDSIARIEKAMQDSIANVEKMHQDSIKRAEKQKIEEQRRLEKEKKDSLEATKKARENEQKRKEEERKEKQRAQEERLKQREKERQEREQQQNERRRQVEKEQKEKVKARELQRKEAEKERNAKQKGSKPDIE